MFYRGFDGPLLTERFLEGNDTHEIKLILAVSRNANVQRAKFYCGRMGLTGTWIKCRLSGEGRDLIEAGLQRGVVSEGRDQEVLCGSGAATETCQTGNALRAGKERLSDPGLIQRSGKAVLPLWHRPSPHPPLFQPTPTALDTET